MFGMLDYRAHKLYRLLSFPIFVSGKITFFLAVAIAIWIAFQFEYGYWPRAVIAYVAMEGISLIVLALYALVMWLYLALFFWLIDVIPSKGIDQNEAWQIVKQGRFVWLSRKLATEIQNWTAQDTREFVSTFNWRSRLLFDGRRRFESRVVNMMDYYHETGVQPGQLRADQLADIAGDQPSWIENAFVHQHFFNAILGAGLILVSLHYFK